MRLLREDGYDWKPFGVGPYRRLESAPTVPQNCIASRPQVWNFADLDGCSGPASSFQEDLRDHGAPVARSAIRLWPPMRNRIAEGLSLDHMASCMAALRLLRCRPRPSGCPAGWTPDLSLLARLQPPFSHLEPRARHLWIRQFRHLATPNGCLCGRDGATRTATPVAG